MALYTHDGVRHNTKEEAINYLEENYITEATPFEDEYYQELHNADWGKYEFQGVPFGLEESLYLELVRYHKNGSTLIKLSDDFRPEPPEEVIHFLQKQIALIEMVKSEVQTHIVQWSKDEDKYIFVGDVADEIPINISFEYLATEEGINTTILYNIDGAFFGEIYISAEEHVDILDTVLKDVESFLLLEATGDYDPVVEKIGEVNLHNILEKANTGNYEVSISFNAKQEEQKEA